MLARRIASRYAQALFDLAQQQHTTEAWDQELSALAAVLAASPELVQVLTHPEVTLARKQEIVERAFQGNVAQEILAMLLMLIRRGHEPDIATVHELFHARWDQARRLVEVTVTSAAPLSDAQAATLTTTLTRQLGAGVLLHRQVDPALIAGMVVRMGDRIIDASARTTLTELREAMLG